VLVANVLFGLSLRTNNGEEILGLQFGWYFPLFTAADYLNMMVSNKKALATLDTVHK